MCQIVSKCFVYVICGCGSVLLSQHCDTLCASSFMDDIILAHNEPYAGVPVLHLNSQPDVQLGRRLWAVAEAVSP